MTNPDVSLIAALLDRSGSMESIADDIRGGFDAYIAVLGAMVCAALLAELPTPWTALGAVCFAISDGMIGIGRFVLESHALDVPIWWVYATSQILITAGFFFGRATT